jgi:hypothetical protein
MKSIANSSSNDRFLTSSVQNIQDEERDIVEPLDRVTLNHKIIHMGSKDSGFSGIRGKASSGRPSRVSNSSVSIGGKTNMSNF